MARPGLANIGVRGWPIEMRSLVNRNKGLANRSEGLGAGLAQGPVDKSEGLGGRAGQAGPAQKYPLLMAL